ncbi:MAG: hypothetical protein IJE05_05820 [Clostridia bacterium]|nr:hypothetical protein [Clostridia bacterium]
MENAVDALKMAGAVLIFVLAISIIILFFGQVRESADTILDYKDRETVYIEGDYYYEQTGKERQVGLETVIPSIFRAYLENYKIAFIGTDGNPLLLYTTITTDKTYIDRYSLDLETDNKNAVFANNEQKAEFLCGILYKDFGKSNESEFGSKFHLKLPTNSLYVQLKSAKKITESLGVYYQNDSKDVQDVNKDQKRIIIYKLSN